MELFDQLINLIAEAADEFDSLQQQLSCEHEEFLATNRRLQDAEQFIRDVGLWNEYIHKEGDGII